MGATASEPDDAPGDGDGRTTGDIAEADADSADGTLQLRAERDGGGSGRVYELTYMARDASGNEAPALALVTVPHDQGSGPEPLLVRLETNGSGGARLYWSGVPGATAYDLLTGDLSKLSLRDDHLSLGPSSVPVRGENITSYAEAGPGPVPAPGKAIFYVLQYRGGDGGKGYGTATAPLPRAPAFYLEECP